MLFRPSAKVILSGSNIPKPQGVRHAFQFLWNGPMIPFLNVSTYANFLHFFLAIKIFIWKYY